MKLLDRRLLLVGWFSALTACNEEKSVRRVIPVAIIPAGTGPIDLGPVFPPTLVSVSTTTSSATIQATYNTSPALSQYVFQMATTLGGPYTTVVQQASRNYTATGLNSGTTYYFRVAVIVVDGRQTVWSSIVSAFTSSISAPTRRYFPGHYVSVLPGQWDANNGIPNGGTVTGTYPNNTASGAVVSNAGPVANNVAGLLTTYNWNQIETFDGHFDFTLPDMHIAQCRALGVGYFMMINTRTFAGTGAGQNPVNGLSLLTYSQTYTLGWQVWRWSPYVLQRFQLLCNQIGNRYDADPTFGGIATQETATSGVTGNTSNHSGNYTVNLSNGLGNFTGNDVYAVNNYVGALIMESNIIAAASPRSRHMLYQNFTNGNNDYTKLQLVAQAVQPNGAMWGFPNLGDGFLGDNVTPDTGSTLGIVNRVYPNSTSYHNGTNGVPNPGITFGAVQPSEWNGNGTPQGSPPHFMLDYFKYGTAQKSDINGNRPLNLDVIVWSWQTGTNINGENFKNALTGAATSPQVPIFNNFPTFGTVTPNP